MDNSRTFLGHLPDMGVRTRGQGGTLAVPPLGNNSVPVFTIKFLCLAQNSVSTMISKQEFLLRIEDSLKLSSKSRKIVTTNSNSDGQKLAEHFCLPLTFFLRTPMLPDISWYVSMPSCDLIFYNTRQKIQLTINILLR